MAESTRIIETFDDDEIVNGHTWEVVGDNNEIQARGERYSSERDARRGLADLSRTILGAIARSEIEMIE